MSGSRESCVVTTSPLMEASYRGLLWMCTLWLLGKFCCTPSSLSLLLVVHPPLICVLIRRWAEKRGWPASWVEASFEKLMDHLTNTKIKANSPVSAGKSVFTSGLLERTESMRDMEEGQWGGACWFCITISSGREGRHGCLYFPYL